jgi:Porin subfamily
MRKIALSVSLVAAATLADVGGTTAAPVEYVKICSLYGADFFYIPQTN